METDNTEIQITLESGSKLTLRKKFVVEVNMDDGFSTISSFYSEMEAASCLQNSARKYQTLGKRFRIITEWEIAGISSK